MSDKKAPPSPQSSSGSLPSDPLLERLLGGIAKALDGLVDGNLELRKAFAELHKFITLHASRTENRISDLQVGIDTFVARIEAVVEHQKTITGVTVDAKRALDDSRRTFDKAVEETGKHRLLEAEQEGAAPALAHKALNFIWPTAMRRGKDAIVWGVKLVAGSVSIGAIAKIIHMLSTGHFQ